MATPRLSLASTMLGAALTSVVISLATSRVVLSQGWIVETAETSASTVGLHLSLALDARGNPHMSYYDDTADDLRYATKSGGVWTRELVDGTASLVGEYTSIAVDVSGVPHITYHDATNGDLKYARRTGGAWILETAEASPNVVGRYTSLALDTSGNPHVIYQDASLFDVRYARKVGGVWIRETADGSAAIVGVNLALALDGNGDPHFSENDNGGGDLRYGRKSGGAWSVEVVDGTGIDAGYWTSIAIDAVGNPHISYYDNTADDLRYATKSGGVWSIEVVESNGFVGTQTSIEVDRKGNPVVSYHGSNNELRLARRISGVWVLETADISANNIGNYTSLELDANDSPHVGEYDITATDVKYAYIPSAVITSPSPGLTWAVGSEQSVEWSVSGGLPLSAGDVALSVDGGASYTPLRTGARDPRVVVRVPHTPTRFASIRFTRASPAIVAYSDSFFMIDATIGLAKFDATRSENGTRLTWETEPGPEAGIRYRVERASEGSFISVADGLDRGEFVDQSPDATSRYRLIAINGLGEEYVLGETSAIGALAADRDILAYPNPTSGPIEILYRVPLDRPMELSIYDLSGRKVRALVTGRQVIGVQSITWDRRDDAGRDVAAGTYFARLTSGDGFWATERITIVR